MALRERIFPIRFIGGLDTKSDDKTAQPASLLACENAVFTRGGTLSKRYGHTILGTTILGTGTTLPAGKALGVRGTELVQFSEDQAHSYLADLDKWSAIGDVQSVVPTLRVIAKRTTDQTGADYATAGGIGLAAWDDSEGGVWLAVLDDDTGRVIVAPRQVDANGSRPRCVVVDGVLHMYFVDAAAGEIYSLVVSPNQPDAASTATANIIRNDLDASNPHYDVDVDATKAFIVWRTSTANTLGAGYVHSSGEIGRPSNGLTSPVTVTATDPDAVAASVDVTGGTNNAVVWFSSSDGIQYHTLNQTLVQVQATQTIDATASPAVTAITAQWARDSVSSARRLHVFYERTASPDQNRTVTRAYDDVLSAAGGTVVGTQRSARLASKAFDDEDHVYVNIAHETTLWTTYFTMREDGLIVSRLLSGVAGGGVSVPHLPHVQTTSRKHTWAGIYKIALESEDSDQFTEKGIQKITLDFDDADAYQTAELGRALYISGGMPQSYDGRQIVEAGFHVAPDDVAAPAQVGPAGDGVNVGTHLYRFAYGWKNAQGEIEWGPTSAGTSVVVSSTAKKVTFTIPTYRITAKDDVFIGAFRSEAGDTASLYLVSTHDPTSTGINGYIANDTTTDTVTFADELSDANLIKREPLYTNGGILSNDNTSMGAQITTAGRRIFYDDPEDPNLVRFSQELRTGFAAEFSPVLTVRPDDFGGAVTGLIEMDDAIVVFKKSAIYFFAGPGPLANPDAGGGFSDPELITSDVGCENARSIEYTPAGVIFQSKKGIYLLGRDRSVRYIGAPVEKFTDPTRENQTIVSSDLIPDRTQIRLLTSSGETLLYDYYFDNWSTFTNHEGLDAVVADGVYYYLRTNGEVFKENTSSFQDGTKDINRVIETAWLHTQEHLQGMQRVWHLYVLGNYKSTHKLLVSWQTDYEPGFTEPIVCDPSEFITTESYGDGLYGAGVYGDEGAVVQRYQFKIHVGEKCEAIRFRFEDSEASGEAFELTEIVLSCGVMRGTYHIADSRTY